MRIAIIGAGGIGGYLAARMIGAGQDIALLARGAHLAAIRETGLRLVEPGTEAVVRPPLASDTAAEIGPVDLVIFAVKNQHLDQAIADARPLFGPETLALPFQNGVEAPDRLAAAFGPGRALIGVARIFANITAPGTITRYGEDGRFTVGAPDGSETAPGPAAVRAAFAAAGVKSPETGDARVDLWTKFVLFAAVSGTTAGGRCRMSDVRAHPALWRIFCGLAEEAAAVGRARGVPLPEDVAARMVAIGERLPAESRASTAHDLEDGRSLEIDWTLGAVVRLGAEAGVPTPVAATVAGLLAPWKAGRPGA